MKSFLTRTLALSSVLSLMGVMGISQAAELTTGPESSPAAMTEDAGEKTAPAAMTEDYTEAKQFKAEGFAVTLPKVLRDPSREVRQIASDKGNIPMSLYATSNQHAAFLMSYNKNSNSGLDDKALQQRVLDAAKKGFMGSMKQPQELTSTYTQIQGYPAIVFEVKAEPKEGQQLYSKVAAVLVKPDRYYQFGFLSDKQDDLQADWVSRFFDTISFSDLPK
jgi:hypothetical protein